MRPRQQTTARTEAKPIARAIKIEIRVTFHIPLV